MELSPSELSNAQLADAMAAGQALVISYKDLADQLIAKANEIANDMSDISIEISKRIASGLN